METAPLDTDARRPAGVRDPDRVSKLNGVHLDELRLPVGAVVTMVLRDGVGFVPVSGTRLKTRDALLIVSTSEIRDQVEQRIEEVSRAGTLARWLDNQG